MRATPSSRWSLRRVVISSRVCVCCGLQLSRARRAAKSFRLILILLYSTGATDIRGICCQGLFQGPLTLLHTPPAYLMPAFINLAPRAQLSRVGTDAHPSAFSDRPLAQIWLPTCISLSLARVHCLRGLVKPGPGPLFRAPKALNAGCLL
jgi:hypothetical protein